MESSVSNQKIKHSEFLSGGGEMGRLIRSFDWSQTPLGAPDGWPQSLRTSVSICLNSNFPICVYWGTDHILIYNDAWSTIPGGKHPWALGKTGKEVWPEIWNDIEPWFISNFKGQPVGANDQILIMERYGYPEECFFDFTFTPIYGDSGYVEGVFNAVIETTYRVINERRNSLLQKLNLKVNQASSMEQLCTIALEVLQENKKDIPFAALYMVNDNKAGLLAADFAVTQAQKQMLVHAAGEPSLLEQYISDLWHQPQTKIITNVSDVILNLPLGYWPEPVEEAMLLPLLAANGKLTGFLISGISPRRKMDSDYKLFLENVAATISNTINNVVSFEEERKKTEALAELDRAKTTFFSNISHEFRTPLTLMLGSLEGLLNNPTENFATTDKEAIETSHRNAMRLLRLVNNLLDFSRLEAGRVQAQYQLTDIAKYTAELASNFRSVVQASGLIFQVRTEAVIQPVYIDREMWEKIVLNLLSNAFKYTLKGSITISLATANGQVILKVRDTGVGIPETELPKMFQRFHRVQNMVGRTYEGTGIGLSLVNELVKLHGGEISVQSKAAEGSVFTVSIPTGKLHLPTQQVFEKELDFTASLSDAFVEEATTLIDHSGTGHESEFFEANATTATVLVVDDNADMRGYITNLLQKQYHVITANNGMEALRKIREQAPQLVVSDIMMPVMDGIGLLKAVKEGVQTQNIPVILLSARAGEESKLEGYAIGADDYLVKPFSAKELLARVASQINIAKKRNNLLQEVYTLFDDVPFAVLVLKGESLIIEFINQYNLNIWQCKKEDVLGKPLFDVRPEIRAGAQGIHAEVYRTGKRFEAKEIPFEFTQNGKADTRYFNAVIDPMRDEDGKIIGQLATSIEVTEQVTARQKLQSSKDQLVFAIDAAELATWDFNPVTNRFTADARYAEWFGISTQEATDNNLALGIIAEEDRERVIAAYKKALENQSGSKYDIIYTIRPNNKPERILRAKGKAWFGEDKIAYRFNGTLQDVTKEIRAKEEIEASEERFRTTFENAAVGIAHVALDGNWLFLNSRISEILGYTKEELGELTFQQVTHPEDLNADLEYLQQLLIGSICTYTMEKRYIRKNGSVVWANITVSLMRKADGAPEHFISIVEDITSRKKAETALQKSEKHLELLSNTVPAMIFYLDADKRYQSYNETFCKWFGINSKEAIGKTVREFIGEEAYKKVLPHLSVAYSGAQERYEMPAPAKLGGIRWLSIVYTPHKNELGKVLGIIAHATDITQSKQVETTLRESENRFRSLADQSPMIVYIVEPNAEATMSYFNANWLHYTGQTFEEAIGRAWDGIVHPDDVQSIFDEYVPAFQNRQSYTLPSVRLKRYDGEYRWHFFKGNPRFLKGEFIGYVGVGFDIHEQKLAEEALKASEGRFRTLAEALPQLVWTTNEEGEYDYASSQWLEYSGLDPHDNATWEKLVHADDMQSMMQAWTNSLQTGKTYHAEARLRSKEGNYRWHFVQGEPIHNAEGKISKWIGAFTDIHDQKTLSESLEKLVAERTKELHRSNEDLQQFAHVASHDLKEPVRKVRTFGSRLEEEFGGLLPDRGKLYLTKMQNAADRMFGLIDGVLNYSTINSLESSIETVDLAVIIQNIETDLEVVVQQKGAQISKGELPVVKGSSVLLNQLFYNLINNSLKFSKPGVPPVISITAQKVEGRQVSNQDIPDAQKEFIQIQVCDNGIGFSSEYEEKIFKTFTRLNSRDNYEGTGLGLALCKKIIERHHGYIYATAKEGEGACFYVLLPV